MCVQGPQRATAKREWKGAGESGGHQRGGGGQDNKRVTELMEAVRDRDGGKVEDVAFASQLGAGEAGGREL